MAQSISQEAIGATGLPGATAASRHAGATASGAPTTGTFAVGDFIVDQSGSTWICTASSQTASATTASGNGNIITFTASNSFSPGQYVNVTGFSNAGYNVSNAVIGSATSTQFTVASSATGTTTGTGTAVTTGTWQLSGVPVNENIAGKNFVINGGMDIWQRGTSFATTSGPYTADRWQAVRAGFVSNLTVSQVSPSLSTFTYAARCQRTSGDTQTNAIIFGQSMETSNSVPMQGQTVTLSFWARAGANYSAASNVLVAAVIGGTGTNENAVTGAYTGAIAQVSNNATLTTSWQKFSYSGTVTSTITELCPKFSYTPTGTAGANDYFDITGVQLEIAPQATPFSRAGGSIGGELALCQRYYWQNNNSAAFMHYALGQVYTGTIATISAQFPVTMRTVPTLIAGGVTSMALTTASNANYALTTLTLDVAGTTTADLVATSGTSGFTAGYATRLIAGPYSANTSYVAFSAEF